MKPAPPVTIALAVMRWNLYRCRGRGGREQIFHRLHRLVYPLQDPHALPLARQAPAHRVTAQHVRDVGVFGAQVAQRDLRSNHPDIPIVLGGPAVGGSLPREWEGMRVLERIDESVQAVEDLLAPAASTASV